MSEIRVVLVNKRSEKEEGNKSDAQVQLQEIKVTNNLINEINFNSTVNRFQYLEELLSKEHANFLQQMTNIVNEQKEIIRQMRTVQKQVREIRLPSINFNRITAQCQQLIRVKKESDKNFKLSQGMLTALAKMDKEVQSIRNPKATEETEQIL